MIGFDNELPDFGVGAYLRNAGFTPDAVSLFVFNPDFVHTHDGGGDDRPLPFDCGSYGGHPTSYERSRQNWTRSQLLGLVRELQGHGVAVFFSIFDIFASDPWIGGHSEILNLLHDGTRSRSISPFKHLSDGTLYEDFFVRQLAAVLGDYGFDGYHQADGYCHPRYSLDKADYSADMAGQFTAHTGAALPDEIGPEQGDEAAVVTRRAAWIWRSVRGEWIRFHADRMVQFCEKVIQAAHGEGKRVVLNNALTRDPFQALYRHGVDYQRIAAAGADGFIVETVAPGVILGGESGQEADPHHDFQAMLLLIAAALPDRKLWCLNNAHDVNEQWDVLLHGPTLLEREIYCETSLFHRKGDGTLRRCVTGPLVCLADGIRAHEWQWLQRWWGLGYGAVPRGIVGATLVWSDAALANQLDDYLTTRRFSTHKLLYELMARGAPVHSVVGVADVAAAKGPLVVLNPHLFPRQELESVLAYEHGSVVLVGDLPEHLPEPALRFADCHEPGNLSCAVYGETSPYEFAIEDETEDIPPDLTDLPEPPYYFRELYFRKVSDSFLKACAGLLAQVSGQVKISYRADVITVRALDMGPTSLRLLVGNDSHYYAITELDVQRTLKSVRVATAFPGTLPPLSDTRICNLRVPGKGMVVLDVELEP
ncbi:MAG: hypothetical protein COZ06_20615 [Armatimonadetes bacterium CG_4_10_14_3_um_filter_66_18]|nr:hypothetical protein [Armatimonadota bacterium]OIP04475.1 MAG: hypothetical protein AUJ96_12690 [Armatimonadetes bacterium CG2_30_66_41]PIU95583.1 MAG: hypothetical protein COS65_01755 [Armatimonadetes bacterium CG06_land_8_20_14_3_00_66_21]PIX47304.1 MAG: hypothetical protein COZ57_08830 [Armatimonadetes bacterium CG_4_8_14_3_um_filter_66_20]PIY44446.1 MAG: hypothetical protein COZ06_20615 [Armatimonadetes bacterium CG_4_10_14_3_um_filter_66_18]PJB74323.1 MAG: hypothetical protein CO096_03